MHTVPLPTELRLLASPGPGPPWPLPLYLTLQDAPALAPAPAPRHLELHARTPTNRRRPPSHAARSERPVGYLRCEARAPSRRHLQQRAATGRQLLRSLAMADLDAPPSSPYTCQFAGGGCPYIGPMAGVECTSESVLRPLAHSLVGAGNS